MTNIEVSDNIRIAKNTMMLFFRMLLMLVVGLYATRIVLLTLGASDYGLYHVVGGIVTMFTFLNSTLSSGTQRFLTFALGEDNIKKLCMVFSTTSYIHILLAIIIFIISETVGLWLLYYKMQIPEGRMTAAFWVFQFSIMVAMVSIVQVPYISLLIAHEKMDVYAWVSIFDSVMKLLMVYLIQVVNTDKLVLFAFLFLLVHFFTAFIYMFYCRGAYAECRMFCGFNKETFKEIATFSGWNVFGSGAVAMQGQGVNILLNMFLGTVVNAARGIASQVNSATMQFVNNFQQAVNPQIVKLYASGQKDKMIRLIVFNSKVAAYLFLLIAVPLFIELEYVLDIWLGSYPDYTPIFIRILIIQSLVQTITRPVVIAVHAVGKMKAVNLTSGIALLLILPVTYILLRLGYSPVMVFWINVIPWFFELFFELYWLNKYIDFPLLGFYHRVYAVVFPLAGLMCAIPYGTKQLVGLDGWQSMIMTCVVSTISTSLIVYCFGISPRLRMQLFNMVYSRIIIFLK